MEVYLIRHTTPDIAAGRCYGQSDIPLKPTFPEEMKTVRKALPAAVEVIYSSPLSRCAMLAKALHPAELVLDPRLMELDFGDWELQYWDNLPQEALNEWMEDFVHNSPPGGESMVELQNRVLAWWRELIFTNSKSVAVVTHAGVIRVLKAYLDDIPLQDAFSKIKVDYGAVISLG